MTRLRALLCQWRAAFLLRARWLRWFLPVFFMVGVLNLVVGNWFTASVVFIMVAMNWVSSKPDVDRSIDWSWAGWLGSVGFPCLAMLMAAGILMHGSGSGWSAFEVSLAAFFVGGSVGLGIVLTRSYVRLYEARAKRALEAAIYDVVTVVYPDESALWSSAEFNDAYDAAWEKVKSERERLLGEWMAVGVRFFVFGVKPSRKVLLVEGGFSPDRALDADVEAFTMEDLETLVALRRYSKDTDDNADLYE